MAEDANTRYNVNSILKTSTVWVLALASVVVVFIPGDHMAKLKLAIGFGLMVLIFLFGFMILLEIAAGRIDLSLLLSESSGGASMSRFQLLIFTFVISLSFFLLVAESGKFPAIPPEVLTLLGISASTYAVSKGIQAGGMPGKKASPTDPAAPTDPSAKTGIVP